MSRLTEAERDELAATAAAEAPEAETPELGAAGEAGITSDDADAAALAAYEDRLLRLQAEFDNYRKRVQRDREEGVKYAGERFVRALLPVLDNFAHALAAIPDTDETAGWRQGVALIQRQLLEVLAREGVEPVAADPGAPFDPHQHEAVLYEAGSEYGEGQIIDELQRGYKLHDRLIRPALVRVAQG